MLECQQQCTKSEHCLAVSRCEALREGREDAGRGDAERIMCRIPHRRLEDAAHAAEALGPDAEAPEQGCDDSMSRIEGTVHHDRTVIAGSDGQRLQHAPPACTGQQVSLMSSACLMLLAPHHEPTIGPEEIVMLGLSACLWLPT